MVFIYAYSFLYLKNMRVSIPQSFGLLMSQFSILNQPFFLLWFPLSVFQGFLCALYILILIRC